MNGVNSMNGAGASRSTAPSTSPSPPTRYLVLDTNVLLSHFPTVKALHARMLGGDAWLLIPTTVVTELDGLKSSSSSTSARAATAWLLDTARAQRRGAASRLRLERWSESENTAVPARGISADDTILACCLHFASANAAGSVAVSVSLWTDDRNLALAAEANGIPTVGTASLAGLCAAVGAGGGGMGAMEAMEVDGDGMETDDRDLPLFTRKQGKHLKGNGAVSAPNGRYDFNDPSAASCLPPPGALAAALAELSSASGPGTRPGTRPAGMGVPGLSRSTSLPGRKHSPYMASAERRQSTRHNQHTPTSTLPPPGALASALAELDKSGKSKTVGSPSQNGTRSATRSQSPTKRSHNQLQHPHSTAAQHHASTTPERRIAPLRRSSTTPLQQSPTPPQPIIAQQQQVLTLPGSNTLRQQQVQAPTMLRPDVSHQGRTVSKPPAPPATSFSTPPASSTWAPPPALTSTPDHRLLTLSSGRRLPLVLATSLASLLAYVCTSFDPTIDPYRPGPGSDTNTTHTADNSASANDTFAHADPTQPATTLFALLSNILSGETAHTRVVARCTGAARTLKAWLTASGRTRAGEAADALLVLLSELAEHGMSLETSVWEEVARGIRDC